MKKFLTGAVLAFAFIIPTSSFAQSDCIDLQYNMRHGSSDAGMDGEVSILQDFLIDEGYFLGESTGYFGPVTRAAVENFQSAVGIVSAGGQGFGMVGPRSRAKIKAMTCGVATTSVTTTATTLAPTATLTANGVTSLSIAPTGSVTFEWNSSNATSYSSFYSARNCSNSAMNATEAIWELNTASGSIPVSDISVWAGCTFTGTYVTRNAVGTAASATVVVSVAPASQTTTAVPTVTLTANKVTSLSIAPTGSVTFEWNSSNATSYSSSYSARGCSNSAMNATNAPWELNTASGSTPAGNLPAWAGCLFTGTYIASNTAGSAGVTVVVSVAQASQTTTTAVPIVTLTANKVTSLSIAPTGSVTFEWNSSNATSYSSSYSARGCSNSAMNATNAPWELNTASGSTTAGNLPAWAGCLFTGTYIASNTAGSAGVTVVVSVLPTTATAAVTAAVTTLAPILSFVATPATISTTAASGGRSVLSWTTTNATSCTASGNLWSGARSIGSGTEYTIPLFGPSNYTYTLTCTGAGGSVSKSVTVVALAPTVTTTAVPTINSFTANPTTVVSGTTGTALTWTTSGATSCSVYGGAYGSSSSTGLSVSVNGTANTSNLTQSTAFYLRCSNSSGTVTRSVDVMVAVQTTTAVTTASIASVGSNSCIIQSGQNTCNVILEVRYSNVANANLYNQSTRSTSFLQGTSGISGSGSYPILYGTQSIQVRNGVTLLASTSLVAICASDTTWNGSICVANQTTTAVTTASIASVGSNSCIIQSGQNTCNVILEVRYSNVANANLYNQSTRSTSFLQGTSGISGSGSYPILYGTQSIQVRNGVTLLASTSLVAICANGTLWNGSICAPNQTITAASAPTINSFTANPNSCTIQSGQSLCNVILAVNYSNVTTPSLYNTSTQSTSLFLQGTSGTSGSGYHPIPHGTNIIQFRNGVTSLASVSLTASCASDTTWNGSICAANQTTTAASAPTINSFTANPNSCTIQSGQSLCNVILAVNYSNVTTPILYNQSTQSTSLFLQGTSGTSGSGYHPIPHGTNIIQFRNGVTSLASVSLTATCASGTTWNGSICAVN